MAGGWAIQHPDRRRPGEGFGERPALPPASTTAIAAQEISGSDSTDEHLIERIDDAFFKKHDGAFFRPLIVDSNDFVFCADRSARLEGPLEDHALLAM